MLCDFVLTLYKVLAKTKKIVLEKSCFQRGFEFSKNVLFTNKKVEHQNLVVQKSSTENVASMIYEVFIWNVI